MKNSRLRLKDPKSNVRRLVALTLAVWLLFIFYSIAGEMLVSTSRISDNIIEVVDPESLKGSIPGKGVSVLYFKQELCPGCAKMEPSLLKYASERRDILFIVAHLDKMLSRDARKTLEVLGEFRVTGTPTLIVYVDGVERGRHTSTFGLGDQYSPLKEFIEGSVMGEAFDVSTGMSTGLALPEPMVRAFNLNYIIASTSGAFILGLIAAFSPCSIPMIAAYSLASRGGGLSPGMVARKSLTIALVAILGGSTMTLLYVASMVLPMPVNVYKLMLSAVASMLVAWGVLTIVSMSSVLIAIPGASKVIPLLGIQCSLPFILVLVALFESAPHIVLANSIVFSLGYITPYIAFSTTAELADRIEAIMKSRAMIVAQGMILVGAGLYILYYVKSIF
ncbi:MAG: hypothetical protein P3X22_004865 [Thermoprotei archaeon]|nr:hypothetical protein [Thermoprotei archaeon]